MAMPVRDHPGKRWTVQEVRALRDRSAGGTRYELVSGELFVTPSPIPRHQIAAHLLCAALYLYVRAHGIGIALIAPLDVDLEDQSTVQPDVLVVPAAAIAGLHANEPIVGLLLASEILSPGSARGDRVEKRALFQRHRVSEYWIVDLEARVFERWHPGDERPQIIADRLEWLPQGASASFVLDLPAYFAEVFGES